MASNGDYATRTDLKALREELKGDLGDVRSKLKSDIAAAEQRVTESLREAIHDTETKLLKAFYEYAESNRLRLVSIETESQTLAKRMAIVEDKLLNLEKRLDLPNAS